ncbi:MAG TPA: hypothetical protein VF812_11630 [Ktedonobacterales bacterium]
MKRLRLRFPVAPTRLAIFGMAVVLLAFTSTLSYQVNASHSQNQWAIVVFLGFLVGFGALFALTMEPALAGWAQRFPVSPRWTTRLRVTATLFMLVLAAITFLLGIAFLHTILFEPTSKAYWNDVISFSAANAHATLDGRNPYTDDANFLPTLLRYPMAPATPIQGPIFGYGYNYPLQPRVFEIDKAYLQHPAAYAAAFNPATLHSYPALSFLLYIPLELFGWDILWLHLLAYGGIFCWLVMLAPKEQRGWIAFAAGASLTIVFNSLMVDTEVICLVFLLVAWHYRERRWVSAIALGLGCAFKQYCWLFAPLLLLDGWLQHGWREALKRAAIAGVTFLIPNAPFILLNPHAWVTSVLLPISGGLFPQGMGLVTLSLGRILPGWPPLFFTVLEALAFVGTLWLYIRYRTVLGESVLLLALVPLAFAFRSPANYFAIAPWLALYAMLMLDRKRLASAAQQGQPVPAAIVAAPGAS